MPRRFGVGVLLILMTFFAVLFALLRSLDYGPEVCAIVGVLFVGVAAGQALLFGGKQPRAASIVVGAVLFPLEMLGLALYRNLVEQPGRGSIVDDTFAGLLCSIAGGALLGYLAGAVTAGIFLVMDRWSKARAEHVPPMVELLPFAEPDIDTLVGWVQSRRLFELWAGATFAYPLDRAQLLRHLQRTSGEQPELLPFKAVCPETGRTVGHVELTHIDRAQRIATLALALVGPAEAERGELSVRLLRSVLSAAFDRMRLYRVQALVLTCDPQAIACYKQLGLASEGVLRGATRLYGRRWDLQVMSILRHEWVWQQRTHRGTARSEASTKP